jgi:FMN phosphatase YigB (HAD superfamily)
LHSKKSLHGGGEQLGWAQFLHNSLIGNRLLTRQIISAFEQDPSLGLVYPVTFKQMPSWVHSWLKNFNAGRVWASRIGLQVPAAEFLIYPVGGMFWARTKALKQILAFPWSYTDFPEESGQIDNTTQHVIERLLELNSSQNEMKSVFIHMNDLTEDTSFAWKDANGLNRKELSNILLNYEVISWDLFDTLIYRQTGQPDYAKYQVGQVLKKYGIIEDPMEYVSIRNSIESDLRLNALTNSDVALNQITQAIIVSQNWNLRPGFLEEEEFRFDLAGLQTRPHMREIYSKFSKKSLVISDSYYSETQLKKIFEKCNLPLPKILISSASNGRRKDRGDIWPYVLQKFVKFPELYIHLGDNSVSDNQVPGDFGIQTLKIYSAKEIYEILSKGNIIQINLDDYVSDLKLQRISNLNQEFFQNPFCLALYQQ